MAMKVKEFLREVTELVRLQVPGPYRGFQTIGPQSSLVKLHFGQPQVHYEVWVQRRQGLVELGLHFEGLPQANACYLESLTRRLPEIRAALGNQVEAEQWTSSWTRVHQSLALESLEEDLLWDVATRVSSMIAVLEPLVREVAKAAPLAKV
jgi:hypothetical protein